MRIGPLVDQKSVLRVKELIVDAVVHGAQVLTRVLRYDFWYPFFEPNVLVNVAQINGGGPRSGFRPSPVAGMLVRPVWAPAIYPTAFSFTTRNTMRFQEDQLTEFAGSDQQPRTIHVWQPAEPRAVILAIHGGMAHAGDYVTPALYFRERGFATVSYDLCGHAKNVRVDIPGFNVFLDDTAVFLEWVRTRYPDKPLFLMGHSMGGLIAAHLELGRFADAKDIKGVILSSPYFVNAVKVPKVMIAFSSVLARWFPRAKVPMAPLTDVLTHDKTLMARHLEDERDHLRASEVSFRFANALLTAQAQLQAGLSKWRHPVFAVLAGDDKLADASASRTLLETIPSPLLEFHWEETNFHENFNEIGRENTFGEIEVWLEKVLAKS